jgi:hypothetical protein
MVLPFLLFFIDFLFFNLFDCCFFHFLLVGFIVQQVLKSNDITISSFFNFYILLLLVEDVFLYGRFGLSLIYTIPIIFFALYARKSLFLHTYIFGGLFIIFSLCVDFFIKKEILGMPFVVYSTIKIIFINLILVFLSIKLINIWGIQGNRSLLKK